MRPSCIILYGAVIPAGVCLRDTFQFISVVLFCILFWPAYFVFYFCPNILYNEKGSENIMTDRKDIFGDDLNPTFLFTWKGTRLCDEKKYHSHDHIEIAFILSGQGRYRIDNELYSVEEGDLLILNPGVQHQALKDGNRKPTMEFFVGFTDVAFREMAPNRLDIADGPVLHTTGDFRQKLFRIVSGMEAENEVLRQGRYFMLRSYLIQMILLIIREQTAPLTQYKGYEFESAGKKYVVEQIINYFSDHYSEKISLDQIAENMYLSPFYISRIFKSETGDTPIRYLIDIRLEHAREILESGNYTSIQEVASRVGYDDAYHFSKLFKKKYDVPPSKIKRKS